jgi:hypothetical protein
VSTPLLGRRRYLTVAEFAAKTGLSETTVRERCRRGCYRLRSRRQPGQHYQIVASEVEAARRPMR